MLQLGFVFIQIFIAQYIFMIRARRAKIRVFILAHIQKDLRQRVSDWDNTLTGVKLVESGPN